MVGCGKMAEALADGLQTTFPSAEVHARVDHRLHQQEDLCGEVGQTRGIGRRVGRQWGAPPRSLALPAQRRGV